MSVLPTAIYIAFSVPCRLGFGCVRCFPWESQPSLGNGIQAGGCEDWGSPAAKMRSSVLITSPFVPSQQQAGDQGTGEGRDSSQVIIASHGINQPEFEDS